MKNASYILLPGLGDQKPIFGWFYRRVEKWWRRAGIDVRVCRMSWVSGESFEAKRDRLVAIVDAERAKGRGVVLVGVSAGAALGAVVFCEHPQDTLFVSICGLLRLKPDDDNTPYTHASWFQATKAGERAIAALGSTEKKNMLTLSARADKVIEPEREQIIGVENILMHARGHLAGIVVGLFAYRKRIVRFVTSKG
jgi:pimeloyl-ACP methyl ester carboxylesterase